MTQRGCNRLDLKDAEPVRLHCPECYGTAMSLPYDCASRTCGLCDGWRWMGNSMIWTKAQEEDMRRREGAAGTIEMVEGTRDSDTAAPRRAVLMFSGGLTRTAVGAEMGAITPFGFCTPACPAGRCAGVNTGVPGPLRHPTLRGYAPRRGAISAVSFCTHAALQAAVPGPTGRTGRRGRRSKPTRHAADRRWAFPCLRDTGLVAGRPDPD